MYNEYNNISQKMGPVYKCVSNEIEDDTICESVIDSINSFCVVLYVVINIGTIGIPHLMVKGYKKYHYKKQSVDCC